MKKLAPPLKPLECLEVGDRLLLKEEHIKEITTQCFEPYMALDCTVVRISPLENGMFELVTSTAICHPLQGEELFPVFPKESPKGEFEKKVSNSTAVMRGNGGTLFNTRLGRTYSID